MLQYTCYDFLGDKVMSRKNSYRNNLIQSVFFSSVIGIFFLLFLSFPASVCRAAGLPGHLHAGPPLAITLHKAAKSLRPDLAVQHLNVILQQRKQKRYPATAIIKVEIKNVGQAASSPTTMTITVTGKGVHRDKTLHIKPLAHGAFQAISWKTGLAAGKNRITVRVKDPNTPKNNTAGKTVMVREMVPIQQIAAGHGAPISTANNRHLPAVIPHAVIPHRPHPVPAGLHPDLSVRRIIFSRPGPLTLQRPGSIKPNETRVRVEIKNVGTARSAATKALGILHRGNGHIERNTLPVPALAPGKSHWITGPIRMTTGRNSLTMTVRDRYNPANNSLTRSIIMKNTEKYEKINHRAHEIQPGKDARLLHHAAPRVEISNAFKPAGKKKQIPMHKPVLRGGAPLPAPPGPQAKPDFEITDCSVSPEHPLRYHTAEIICHVINNGDDYPVNSRDSFQVTLDIHGPLGSENIAPVTRHGHISPYEHLHQAEEFRFQADIPASGTYSGTARVRFLSGNRETNTANNSRHFQFSTSTLPDLQVYITRPSDVRVGGHKRWFRFFVKNVGTASSQSTTLRLHIDRDGTHTWEVPPLAPGERFPGPDQWKKRGIRWWKKGRKHYVIEVNRDHTFQEANWDNNRIRDSLEVYIGAHFNPKATVDVFPKIYLKNHAEFHVGGQEKLTFVAVVNQNSIHMAPKTKIDIYLTAPPATGNIAYREQVIPALLPGERYAVIWPKRFDHAQRYNYTIKMYQFKHGQWLINPVWEHTGYFDVAPVLGEPVFHD